MTSLLNDDGVVCNTVVAAEVTGMSRAKTFGDYRYDRQSVVEMEDVPPCRSRFSENRHEEVLDIGMSIKSAKRLGAKLSRAKMSNNDLPEDLAEKLNSFKDKAEPRRVVLPIITQDDLPSHSLDDCWVDGMSVPDYLAIAA